jgi:hypothetical protein
MNAPAESARRTWSPARRAAANGERITIPLLLSGQGQVGSLTLPPSLSREEWDIITGTIEAFAPAIVREEADE